MAKGTLTFTKIIISLIQIMFVLKISYKFANMKIHCTAN